MHGYNNRTIVIHELADLDVEIVQSKDQDQVGIKGKVVKETKNLIYVNAGNNIKRIVKNISVFRFVAEGRSFLVKGDTIAFRSHERTGKALRYYKKRKMQS